MVDFNRLMDDAGIGNDQPIGRKFLRICGLAVNEAVAMGLLPAAHENRFGATLQDAADRWLKASDRPMIDLTVMKDMLSQAGEVLPRAARELQHAPGRPNITAMLESFGEQAKTLLAQPDHGLGMAQRPAKGVPLTIVKTGPAKA